MSQRNVTIAFSEEEFKEVIFNAVSKAIAEINITNSPIETQKQIFTRKETAKMLGISLTTLYNYTKQGVIKSCTVGYSVRYSKEDIDAALVEVPLMRLVKNDSFYSDKLKFIPRNN